MDRHPPAVAPMGPCLGAHTDPPPVRTWGDIMHLRPRIFMGMHLAQGLLPPAYTFVDTQGPTNSICSHTPSCLQGSWHDIHMFTV